METTQRLATAWAAVNAAGIPEHLHEVAFKAALALNDAPVPNIAPKQEGNSLAVSPPQERPLGDGIPAATEDSFFETFSHESGVERNDLERVFFFHNGLPGLNGPARKLGRTRADQTRAVALLLTAAYHFGLHDDVDRVAAVRRECERIRCYDLKNFARELSSTKGLNFTGPKGAKVLKTRPDTIDALKALVSQVQGSDE